MRRVWPIAALLLALVALGLAPAAPAAASTPAPARAIVVLAPGLAWGDITATGTPTLWRLAAEGALGDLNGALRTRESAEAQSAQEGALDISAGNWATPEFFALGAFGVGESVEGSSAALAYRRRTGVSVDGNAIAYVGMPPAVRKSTATADDVVVGTLGQAVEDSGGVTIAVGNSDSGDAVVGYKTERPAALAAMDETGLVRLGDVSRDLLAESPEAPYGLKTDLAAFGAALAAAEASATAHGGPALIVLDPGDAYRAQRFAWQAQDAVASVQHDAAMHELDVVVSLALKTATATDLVIVAGQSAPVVPAAGVPGFSPLLASGGGLRGYLTSASTHRQGIVSNPDITAQVMRALGLERPVQVIGSPLSSSVAPNSAAERIAFLTRLDTTAVAQNAVRGTFASLFAWLFVAIVLFAAAFIWLRLRVGPRWREPATVALQALCAVPPCLAAGAWVMFVLTPTVSSPAEMWLSLLAAGVVLFVFAALVRRLAGGRWPIIALLLGTVAVLTLDQLLGAQLSRTNLIGYSPLDSARYYGIGNEAAALLLGSALTGIAMLVDELGDSAVASFVRRIGLPVVGAAIVLACAAPFLGANVGVAIWGSAGIVVAWMLMNGRRITWKTALVLVLVVAVVIGAFAAIDFFGGGAQTHLARSLTNAQEGGVSQLVLIVQRKAETNARVLGESSWSIMLVTIVAFLLFLRAVPDRPLTRLLAENPAFRSVLIAGAVAGVLAFLTEDTGIDVPSWIWLPLGVAAVWLAVTAAGEDRAAR